MSQTTAQKFKTIAAKLMPHYEEFQELDDAIDSADQIDEIFFRRNEYIGGMAAVFLAIIKNEA